MSDHLPSNEDAEVSLLAALLSDPRKALAALSSHAAAPEYFYDIKHRHIFEDVAECVAIGTPIEVFIVQGAPERRSYVAALMGRSMAPELAPVFADELRGYYIRRRQIEAARLLERGARGGDADAIEQGQKILIEFESQRPPELVELIRARLFDPALNPPLVRPVYTLAGADICTAGNIATITAHAKAGKSGLINAMLAAPMATAGMDTLGVKAENPNGLAVVHIDTEQSRADHWHQIARAVHRAGRETKPLWLVSGCFTDFGARRAREATWILIEMAAKEFGGVHSVHIDGCADLVCDVNDAAECNEFVGELHAGAIKYDCPITGVIHFNPGTEKTRGHLGSQLERKAETNLRIDKDGEVSEVWSDKQRRAPILKGQGPRYQWSTDRKMHVSIESGKSAKTMARIQDAKDLRDDVFQGKISMRKCDMEKEVQTATRKSDSTAGRIVKDWVSFGIIEKSIGGLWIPKD